MKKYFLILVILLIINPIQAQVQYLEKNKNYPIAKIYQKGMPAFRVKNLTFSNDTVLQYTLTDNNGLSRNIQLATSNVRYVGVKTGSYAVIYGAAGGAVGLLSSLYGVLSVKSDPTLDDSGVNWAPFVIGFTAGGALVGGIIGAFIPRWKMHYFADKKTSYSIGISPDVNMNYYGLGLKIKF